MVVNVVSQLSYINIIGFGKGEIKGNVEEWKYKGIMFKRI